MFNGTDPGAALFDGSTARYVNYVITVCINYRGAGNINTLEFDTMVRFCGYKGHVRLHTCMKSYTRECNRFLNSLLFDIEHGIAKVRKFKLKSSDYPILSRYDGFLVRGHRLILSCLDFVLQLFEAVVDIGKFLENGVRLVK